MLHCVGGRRVQRMSVVGALKPQVIGDDIAHVDTGDIQPGHKNVMVNCKARDFFHQFYSPVSADCVVLPPLPFTTELSKIMLPSDMTFGSLPSICST